MHDGELTAASPGPGKGSVFTLAVPADVGTTEIAPRIGTTPCTFESQCFNGHSRHRRQPGRCRGSRGFAREPWLQVACRTLRAGGSRSRPKMRPQVILCDIGLPGMDGNEVCRRVRELSPDYKPIMVALTGWGMEADRRRTQETGFESSFSPSLLRHRCSSRSSTPWVRLCWLVPILVAHRNPRAPDRFSRRWVQRRGARDTSSMEPWQSWPEIGIRSSHQQRTNAGRLRSVGA